MIIEAMKQALESAYLAGFYRSGEGYNSDYPFSNKGLDPLDDPYWIESRDAYVRTAIEQAAKQGLDQNLSDQSLAIRTRQYANGAQAGWNLAIAGDSEGLRHLEDFARAVEARLTHTTKTWSDGEKVVTQEIPESEIYEQKPVAWLYVNEDMPNNRQLEWTETREGYAGDWRKYPLYAAPTAAQKPVAWQQELGNILCCIHRDGGQYISEHGWRKAIDDATLKMAKLNAASDNQKPIAYKWKGEMFTPGEIEMLDVDDAVPLYEHPRQWVGLTDEEKRQIVLDDPIDWVAAIEAKLKEKNHAVS